MKTVFACATILCALGSTALQASTGTTATTGVTGSGLAFDNRAPGLVVTDVVTLQGLYPVRNGLSIGAAQTNAVGGDNYFASIDMFAGNYAPIDGATANGQILPINQNAALYSLLGTTYGGNGVQNFALPNLAGRNMTGATDYGNGPTLGQQYGSTSVTLTTANMPDHDHTATVNGQTVTTSAVGGGQAYDSSKPSLAVTYLVQTQGIYPSYGGNGAADGLLGQIGAFAGNFVPAGYAAANGQLLSISSNQALFSIFGTTYGGDGVHTFALPNLNGRTAVGVGQGAGMAPVTLGEAFGSNSTTLTEAQLPAHVHTLPGGGVTSIEGDNAPIDNYGASLGLNYMIAVNGLYPSRNSTLIQPDVAMSGDDAQLGEISLWGGNQAPSGWMFADGQILKIAQYQALFAVLGTMYGGDGVTTFALPDFRGRSALGSGYDAQDGQSYYAGEDVGLASITLNTANLPPHDHTYTVPPAPQAAVPEPATWASMIVGFALVGGAARRRSRLVKA